MKSVQDSDLVLTLQSSVAYGHVGNATAAFAMQRLGRDVIRIDTVRFSNHPKHGGYSGGPAAAADIDALVDGLAARGLLGQVAAVISGYLGTAENAAAVARAVQAVRAARPDALYCLDPVIGDWPAGRYVDAAIPPAIVSDLLPLADIVTPNAFELAWLSGRTVDSLESAAAAARTLAAPGRLVVATGVRLGDSLASLALTAKAGWRVTAPVVDAPAFGAGDLFSALFLARYLEQGAPDAALALAASAVHAVFEATRRLGRPELALIAAQAALAAPPRLFAAERI